jgi:hypothetical protein
MSEPRDASEFLRSLPATLAALLVAVFAVDILLAFQPTWLDALSHAWRSMFAMRPVLAPASNVLAASLAVVSVVISGALLLGFSRAVAVAPHASLAPAWVALCMLSVLRVTAPLPLPMSLPLFGVLSALLFVGACSALCSGSRAGNVFGWMLVAAPLVVFAASYGSAARGAFSFGRDAVLLLLGLSLSAVGVVLLAFMRTRAQGSSEAELEGLDVVDELLAQLERAERSEARVAELERQLSAYTQPETRQQRAQTRGTH